jgi:hypothetical protein
MLHCKRRPLGLPRRQLAVLIVLDCNHNHSDSASRQTDDSTWFSACDAFEEGREGAVFEQKNPIAISVFDGELRVPFAAPPSLHAGLRPERANRQAVGMP